MGSDEELKRELIQDFHTQFAQNQNHHQNLMIQFFAAFIALLVVYAYATLNVITYLKKTATLYKIGSIDEIIKTNKFMISEKFYFNFSLALSFIFVFIFLYICQVAYAYRRDLKVIRKIRDTYCEELFEDYGSRKILYIWPPDFYAIIMLGILLLTIGIGIWVHNFTDNVYYNFNCFVPQILIILVCYWGYWYKYKQRCTEKEKASRR